MMSRYLLGFFIFVAILAAGLFFVFKPKLNPETTAYSFAGVIVDVGNDGENYFLLANGVPVLEDEKLEPLGPDDAEQRKIIIGSSTVIEKRFTVFPKEGRIDNSDIKYEFEPGSIDELQKYKNREIRATAKNNIFFEKEFSAQRIEVHLYRL